MILAASCIPPIIVATQKQVVSTLLAFALPIGVSVLGLALVMGGLEVLKRLEKGGWKLQEARLSNWALYYGCLGLAGFALGTLRGHMMIFLEGPGTSEWLLTAERGLCTYGTLLVATVMDQQYHFERKAMTKREESRRAVRTLFESREAWFQARDRRRDELHRLLEQRVEPELDALHAALDPAQAAEDATLLRDRLDRLRDEEIRRLSHLLHPSIVDIGLHPALRGLVRRYRPSFGISLEADPAMLERFSAPLRLNLYRVVELLLENAASGGNSRPLTIRLAGGAGGVSLEVSGEPDAFDFERARQDGQLALLEARMALLGGDWEFLARARSGVRVRLSAGLASA